MLLNVVLWFNVTHTFNGNGPKLEDWSKWICITHWSCFCGFLTSNLEASTSRHITVSLVLLKFHKTLSYIRVLMTLKQIFKLENIPFVYLHDILKRLLGKIFFDASFMCLSRLVAIDVTSNNLGSWTSHCGLLSRKHLRLTDQNWQTGPNELVLHFKVGFVVCWHQSRKFVPVVYITLSSNLLKLHNTSTKVRILMTLEQIF